MSLLSETRSCENCGGGFVPSYRPQRFCSRKCWARSRADSLNSNWRGGKSTHPLYEIYHDMIGRCHRPTHLRYADYGGRGITVCERWRADFWAFVADMGERPAGKSLDRINNDGNYEPDNCRWATGEQQRANRRPQRRKRTCKHGHSYTPENTRFDRFGKRHCRACERRWAAEARARKQVAA